MTETPLNTETQARPSLGGHLEICRFDHWFKNVFVLPGIVAALAMDPATHDGSMIGTALLGLLSIGFTASSNYTINEVLDAPHDREHPKKQFRPVPAGRVSIPLAYVQWIALFVLSLALAALISLPYVLTMVALWVMGCVYNIRPLRSKELPYLDVISESVNNPIRMLAGWFIAGSSLLPPTSLLLSYWMFGSFFMSMKRFAEYRSIGDPKRAAQYRRSFGFYTEGRLLASTVIYIAGACLLFGAFLMRYRLELVIAFPLVAWVVGEYFHLGLRPDSPVQAPEHLYRERRLMLALLACATALGVLLFVNVPLLQSVFEKSQSH